MRILLNLSSRKQKTHLPSENEMKVEHCWHNYWAKLFHSPFLSSLRPRLLHSPGTSPQHPAVYLGQERSSLICFLEYYNSFYSPSHLTEVEVPLLLEPLHGQLHLHHLVVEILDLRLGLRPAPTRAVRRPATARGQFDCWYKSAYKSKVQGVCGFTL